jgi:hydrophobe/amphiphile efflux-1 (HAE1) family protein
MAASGFSLNTLTLFGLVLAIGIVVDDAIVVVEAVEHHIEEEMSPRDAAIQAMDEVSGPVIAVGLVLSAVFVPCAFISGIVGQFFRQFALTIAISTVISAFNSLTLSPALAVLLLKPKTQGHGEAIPRFGFILGFGWAGWQFATPWLLQVLSQHLPDLGPAISEYVPWIAAILGGLSGWILSRPINAVLGWFFRVFNRGFMMVTNGYVGSVGHLMRGSVVALLVYAGLLYATYDQFSKTPTGFIPAQDKGYLLVDVRLPDSASLDRTIEVMRQIEGIAGEARGIRHTVAIAGQSILLSANAANFGTMYLMLDDFQNRRGDDLTSDAIARRLKTQFDEAVQDGIVNVLGAPPIDGLGTAGGFKIVIEDRGDNTLNALQSVSQNIVDEGNETAGLTGVFTSFRADTPWLYLDVDRTEAKQMGISMAEVFNTLQVYFGSLYVNDFNRFGRTWQVNVQADAKFRMQSEDLKRLKVRNDQGDMVPLAAIASVREISGPVMLNRYNLYPAALINANAGPETSSGTAIDLFERVSQQHLAPSMRCEWTELALLQLQAGNTAMYAFILAVVLVFLVLAAQYESWSLPLAVILVVPMCLLCSIAGVIAARMDINIFTQIGFVVLVGLACKNAILIVEFARSRHEQGIDRFQATLDACKLRLRPIIMTSFAFIFGVVPLVLGEGAGAEMRRTLGTAVFAGMLGVTLFGIFLTPVFFYVIQWIADWRAARGTDGMPMHVD